MFVYMFIQAGAMVLGLPEALQKALMVFGSMGVLTIVGKICHRKRMDGRTITHV